MMTARLGVARFISCHKKSKTGSKLSSWYSQLTTGLGLFEASKLARTLNAATENAMRLGIQLNFVTLGLSNNGCCCCSECMYAACIYLSTTKNVGQN